MADTLNDSIEYLNAQIETTEAELADVRGQLSSLRQDVLALEARQRRAEAMITGFKEAVQMLEGATQS